MYFDNRLIRKKSFDYGYACTVHRSQGSDYNNIFVDMKDIGLCKDDAIRRQLQYVALSRTRNNALIFQ
jgi:exodeoxyribonuclease-5